MFRVGDRIKCIRKPDVGSWQLNDSNPIDKIYKVAHLHAREPYIQLKDHEGWFDIKHFILSERISLSEIEWLDRVQENFKEF